MKRCAYTLTFVLLMLLVCGSALAEALADDPVVVRVGDFSYTQSQLQGSLDALRYYQLEKLNGLLEGWRADYEIETHPELLTY